VILTLILEFLRYVQDEWAAVANAIFPYSYFFFGHVAHFSMISR